MRVGGTPRVCWKARTTRTAVTIVSNPKAISPQCLVTPSFNMTATLPRTGHNALFPGEASDFPSERERSGLDKLDQPGSRQSSTNRGLDKLDQPGSRQARPTWVSTTTRAVGYRI